MRYYDDTTIKKVERTYNNGKDMCSQLIFITKITKQYLYGNSWNGRWKCDRKTDVWYQYENYTWKQRSGVFRKIG